MASQVTDPDYRRRSGSTTRFIRQILPLLLFFIFATGAMLAVYFFFNPDSEPNDLISGDVAPESFVLGPDAAMAPINKPVVPRPVEQRLVQSPPPRKIGIIAGHRGSDSGTECEDGLTEVQVTSSIAERLAEKLRQLGVEVETLDEFDTRLDNYSASALVSIHIDSCDFINDEATGFKIAGSPFTDSSALTICLQQEYETETGLQYHAHSVTPHMSDYHAFRRISPGTPALIIEVGFLNLDRDLLTIGSDSVVQGLYNGIDCYQNQ